MLITKKTFAICLTVLSLSSCASPPSVDTDIDNTVGSEAETKIANYEFISADQVAKDALETIKSEHAQFDLTEVKDIQIPSELYILSLKKNNELKNTDDVFEIFEGADIWGKCEIQKSVDQQGIEYREIHDDVIKYYLTNGSDGFLAYLSPVSYEDSFNTQFINMGAFHVGRNDAFDTSYELFDKKYPVGDAIADVNKWLIEKYKKIEPDYDCEVKDVIVREYDEKCFYQFNIEKKYKGIPLISSRNIFRFNENYTDPNDAIITVMLCSRMMAMMYNASEINTFTNEGCILSPVEQGMYDKIISLSSALYYCERYFSEYNKIKVSEIGLKYAIFPTGNKNEFDGRLMWEFLIDVPVEEYCPQNTPNTYGYIYKYIYVDAVTGEIYYDFNVALE